MPYKEVKGNIFNSKAQALVNTVNCVGVMGKGIALEFKRRYPIMFNEYKEICEIGKLRPGQILPYKHQDTWILNFAIKDDWKQPSKLEWIESCLKEFVNIYQEMGIKFIAFPWMGAMNGGIPIEKIKEITRNYLSEIKDIDIEIYDFDPDATDPLFEKLITTIKLRRSNINDLSKISGIQPRYMGEIINTLKQENIRSLPRLIESGVIGKTSVEKLYAFLMKVDINENFAYQKPLF